MRKRSSTAKRTKRAPSSKTSDATLPGQTELWHIAEPLLEFAHGQRMEYPRDGLYLFGPCDSEKRPKSTRFGIIGTHEGIERFARLSSRMRSYIPIPVPGPRSRKIEPQHVPFPGFQEAFNSEWPEQPVAVIDDLTLEEIEETIRIENRHEAIHSCVDLFVSRLEREDNRLEDPPSFWFVIIPEIVYELGRPQSRVPRAEAVTGTVTISKKKAEGFKIAPSLFAEEQRGADVYEYATHFRRQLKARLLKSKIVTQIVRETTLAPEDFTKANGMPLRRLEDPATMGWKLGTGAYYNSGGRPWQLAQVRPGVCYVGLVYKRTELTADVRHACCAAQMFLSNGEGVVFRGAPGAWFHPDTKQYHLDQAAANVQQFLCVSRDIDCEVFITHVLTPPLPREGQIAHQDCYPNPDNVGLTGVYGMDHVFYLRAGSLLAGQSTQTRRAASPPNGANVQRRGPIHEFAAALGVSTGMVGFVDAYRSKTHFVFVKSDVAFTGVDGRREKAKPYQ